jgi:hypothetical protein
LSFFFIMSFRLKFVVFESASSRSPVKAQADGQNYHRKRTILREARCIPVLGPELARPGFPRAYRVVGDSQQFNDLVRCPLLHLPPGIGSRKPSDLRLIR